MARALQRYHDTEALLIYGDGQPKTPHQIYEKAVDWVKNRGCGCIFIDYVQKMRHIGRSNAKRQELIQATSESLKEMQRELKVPVIALAQLNRGPMNQQGGGKPRPPRVTDLRECGDLEQDADVVILLDRPHALNPPLPHDYTKSPFPGMKHAGDPVPVDMNGKCALHVAKNRNGRTDFTIVHYEAPVMRFHEDTPI